MRRFRCVTFGCRVNQYETQAIREQLLSLGHLEVSEDHSCDLLVVNSCTVTEAADRECVAFLRRFHEREPQAQVLVTGCLVQRDAKLLSDLPGVRLLVGTHQKHRIGDLVSQMDSWDLTPRVESQMDAVYAPLRISGFEGRSKAFVKIQDGCDRSCAFCKIPLVRGRSRSRALPDALLEIGRLVERGFQEVVLTGVAIGLWGREWNPPGHLADLINAVDRLPGRFRVRLSSLDPRDLDERLTAALLSSKRFCHHLHLSLQAGSDPILSRMRRGYTREDYFRRVAALRRGWPDMGLTTDLIAGFPGETEKEFEETLDFCRQMLFAKVHVFPYSPRRGTSAWFSKEQLFRSTITARARVLRCVASETAASFRRRFVGTWQEVLVEETGAGYTGNFIRVQVGAQGKAGELYKFFFCHP